MFGAKVNNLLLGEKNFVDFVDKNLGQEMDRLNGNGLQVEEVCHHLIGGSSCLDYPRLISHDFCDIVSAFDIYIQAFTQQDRSSTQLGYGIFIFQGDTPSVKNERMSKMPFKGTELSERQFVNAFFQASVKIRKHITDCLEESLKFGRLENFPCIISNVAIIRNYVWIFQHSLNLDSKTSEKLQADYTEYDELLEAVSDHMVQSNLNLLTTYCLHGEQSQDWCSEQSYYEGLRSSPTVHMWNYFLRETKRDLWRITPPQLSQRVLAIILNDSLTILAGRYSQIKPSDAMKIQFCVDIINILETVHELLFYVTTTLEQFRDDDPTNEVIFYVHQKCNCLGSTLLLVGAPIEVLYKSFRRGLSYFSTREPANEDDLEQQPFWIQVLTTLCRKSSVHCNKLELASSLLLLCGQPIVNWTLVYKVIALNDFFVSTTIFQLFPVEAITPTNFLLEGAGFQNCLRAGCFSDCHSLPKSISRQNVVSCVFYILSHTIPRKKLANIFRNSLVFIDDWTVMDRAQVWTSNRRPMWFQCFIDLLLPIMKTCVQELCHHLFRKRDEHTTQLVVHLLNSTADLLSIIPRSFFLICEDIDDLIPSGIHPVRNSVPVHLLVTTLYQLLNLGPGIVVSATLILKTEGSAAEPLEEQDVQVLLSILLSVSERLCHLDDPAFDQTLHRMTSQMDSMMRQSQAETGQTPIQKSPFIVTEDLAMLKVNFLLEEPEGQIALWTLYWFLVTNSQVIHHSILHGTTKPVTDVVSQPSQAPPRARSSKVAPALPSPQVQSSPISKFIAPTIKTFPTPRNSLQSFHYVNGLRTFDEIVWNFRQSLDWVKTVRQCKIGLQRFFILQQLQRRPDFQRDKSGNEDSGESTVLLQKMITEITALLSVKTG